MLDICEEIKMSSNFATDIFQHRIHAREKGLGRSLPPGNRLKSNREEAVELLVELVDYLAGMSHS